MALPAAGGAPEPDAEPDPEGFALPLAGGCWSDIGEVLCDEDGMLTSGLRRSTPAIIEQASFDLNSY